MVTEETTVHVMGPPDPARELKAGERYCTDLDRGQLVIFHVDSRRVGTHYRCEDCGATDSGASS